MSQTILITGAGRGIGRSLAEAAHSAGWSVIGTARTPTPVEGVEMLPLDVTSAEDHARLAEQLAGRSIDTVVCNAGVFPARGPIDNPEYTADAWTLAMLTNVAGPFFAVRALLPNLKAAAAPRVAIISSRMGSNAHARGGSYIYRASKAAATNLASNLAVDLRDDGIACGSYHPGWVRTDMGTSAADVAVEDSAAGLLQRIAALSMDTTGTFETFDGEKLAF